MPVLKELGHPTAKAGPVQIKRPVGCLENCSNGLHLGVAGNCGNKPTLVRNYG